MSCALDWQRGTACSRAEIRLPELTAGTILVPSLSWGTDACYRFRFSLKIADQVYALNEVPSAKKADAVNEISLSTHIDCFHIKRTIPDARLVVEAEGSPDEASYLLCVTARPIQNESVELSAQDALCATPPALSQMQADDAIKQRICSPTCLAMLLQHYDKPIDWLDFVTTCYDEATGTYGVWPLGIWAASRQGCLGAVEVLPDWGNILRVLDRGMPLVASIRYGEGALPGAPLTSTAGHLVVVYGVDGTNVHVLDPAAPTAAEVVRTYPLPSFSDAWLRYRGAAYILLP